MRVILDCLMYTGPDSLTDRLTRMGYVEHGVEYGGRCITPNANPILLGHASIEIKITPEGNSKPCVQDILYYSFSANDFALTIKKI